MWLQSGHKAEELLFRGFLVVFTQKSLNTLRNEVFWLSDIELLEIYATSGTIRDFIRFALGMYHSIN